MMRAMKVYEVGGAVRDALLGLPPKRQATMLSLAAMRAWRLARVTMLIQYLYRDEPQLSRFQTGLVFVDNRLKPSLQAFKLPFAEMRRVGFQAHDGRIFEALAGRGGILVAIRSDPRAADALALLHSYGGGNAAIGAWTGRV